jgi:DNA-binding protein HU-beta
MTRKKSNKNLEVLKPDFIRLLANESQFTLGDTMKIWNSIEVLIERIIENGKDIEIAGFGRFYSKTIKEHKHWSNLTKEYIMVPEKKGMVFKVAKPFQNAINGLETEYPEIIKNANDFLEELDEPYEKDFGDLNE